VERTTTPGVTVYTDEWSGYDHQGQRTLTC
jgi:hypothetical protein